MFGEMRVDGDNSGFKVDTEAIWRVGDESGLRRAPSQSGPGSSQCAKLIPAATQWTTRWLQWFQQVTGDQLAATRSKPTPELFSSKSSQLW